VDCVEIFTLAQLKMWSWLTNKERLANFAYPQWCLNPIEYFKSIKKDNS